MYLYYTFISKPLWTLWTISRDHQIYCLLCDSWSLRCQWWQQDFDSNGPLFESSRGRGWIKWKMSVLLIWVPFNFLRNIQYIYIYMFIQRCFVFYTYYDPTDPFLSLWQPTKKWKNISQRAHWWCHVQDFDGFDQLSGWVGVFLFPHVLFQRLQWVDVPVGAKRYWGEKSMHMFAWYWFTLGPKRSLEHPQIMTVSFDCHDSWPDLTCQHILVILFGFLFGMLDVIQLC